eukprot:6521963-Pyramimonas_sp.AAC.1
MEALMGSMIGEIPFPKSTSGFCLEADYGLLRFLPTKRDPIMQSLDHFLSWLSQRREGEPAPAKEHRAMGQDPKAGEPPTIGAWPAADTV